MPNETLLQTIKETYNEVAAKRNAAQLTLEASRNAYRNAAANLQNAEVQRDLARQAEEGIRRKQCELADYCESLLDKPQALIQKIDAFNIALINQKTRTQRAEEIVAQCQRGVEHAQVKFNIAECDFQKLNSQVNELSAHLARLN